MTHTFRDVAPALFDNGYLPVPVKARDKAPIPLDWTQYRFAHADVDRYGGASVGILCGHVVGIDIDITDDDLAARVEALVRQRLGTAPRRIGRAPKALLIYRTEMPFAKLQTRGYRLPSDAPEAKPHKVEVLAAGQQFVAYGIHPDTGRPYSWNGTGNPLDVPAAELQPVTEQQLRELLLELDELLAEYGTPTGRIRDEDGDRPHEPNEQQRGDPAVIRSAVSAIPNDDLDYDDWIYLGLAIKGALGEDGADVWREFSARSAKNRPEETERAWRSFKPTKIGAGTLIYQARKHGWRPSVESSDWPVPLDIFRDLVAAPFSLEDVPEPIARFAEAQAAATGFDRSAAIVVAVAAAAAVIDDRYRMLVRSGGEQPWRESARLWVTLIGGPSAGKSPTIRAATDPIKKLHREAWVKWQRANADKKPEERDPEPCLYTSDTTLEALSDALKGNPRGILMLTEEFSSWIGSIDAYRNGQGSRDRGEMLQLYDGGAHQVNRVKRGSFLVPNWSASVIAAGTPAGLRQQVKQLPDDGLIHRFIPVVMQRPGPRGAATPTRSIGGMTWEQTLRYLYEKTTTEEFAQRARLTAEAAAVFDAEEAALRELTADTESISPPLASHYGKHPGLIARVALVFHLLRQEQSEGITLSTMEMACRFMRTVRKHAAVLFLDILQASPTRELARAIGRAIAASPARKEPISRGWITHHCRMFRDAEDQQRRAAVEYLEDAGWIRKLPESRPYGGWAATGWEINPAVYQKFSEVGAEHRRRRENVRAAIMGEDK